MEVFSLWHTRLKAIASAAVLAKLSAQSALSLQEQTNTKSTLANALNAVLAQAFVQ